MFQNTSRIESIEGLRFYEQDILYDNYTYSGDIELTIDVQYLSPGFGIILLNNEGLLISEQKEMLLFKAGYKEASIIYKYDYMQKNLKKNSIALKPPSENTRFIFRKRGKNITFTTTDSIAPLIEYTLQNDNWDKFSLGIYSNSGNVVKHIDIAAPIPYGWNLNMHNTDGGYVKFIKSGFSFQDCNYDAELEQENIQLKAGHYYLKYEIDPTLPCDIIPYVYMYKDEDIYTKKKNILIDQSYFDLDKDSAVSLKFIGRNGFISNIHICERVSDPYIATKDNNYEIKGSSITIDLDNVEYITWSGIIHDIPISINDGNDPFVISNGKQTFLDTDLNLSLNKYYDFKYIVADQYLMITDNANKSNTYSKEFNEASDKILLFYNMDAVIKDLKIKLVTSDTVTDYTSIKNNIKYVTKDITSPIIVVDNENVPLDLSSSYRFVDKDFNGEKIRKYIFTNVEREIFKPTGIFMLEKLPVTDNNQIHVYGIYKDTPIHEDMIFANTKEGIDDIQLYADNYIDITDRITSINYATGRIIIDDVSEFQMIVIDYLKKDSYCINYLYETSLYQVEVSNENKDFYLIYDKIETTNGVAEQEHYKELMLSNTEIMKPINSTYIVIRKE